MQWEAYNFSDDFQDAIIACLVTYPEQFTGFGEIIEPHFFNGPLAVETVYWLKEYVKKYGSYPNFSTLGNYVFENAKRRMGERAKELFTYVQRLADVDTRDWQAVRDLAIKFARERALFASMRKIITAQQEGKGHEVDPVKEMQTALDVGTNLDDLGIHLYYDAEYVIRKVNTANYGVPTGFPALDKLWRNGWAAGWLIALLAPPKRYKTTFAINLALNIASQRTTGGDVLYYACEISQELAMMRAIHNITGKSDNYLFENGLDNFINIAKADIPKRVHNHVWFKGFPSKGATVADIRSNARQVVQRFGIKPRAVFIDYAETVKSSLIGKNDPDYRKQADVYTEARSLGAELGCCVILPDRCTRETVERKVPSMVSFQGSFEKAGIVDVALGLCATEAEHKQNTIRYFIFLNRHGEQYKHYTGKVDPALSRMTLEKEIDYDPDEEENERQNRRRSGKGAKSRMLKDDHSELTQQAY